MNLPEPITRKEIYLKAITENGGGGGGGGSVDLPEPVTREEIFLKAIADNGGGGGGTTDYEQLTNKPKVNGVELSGDKSASQLGLQSALTFDDTPTEGSNNPVKSGGIFDKSSDLASILLAPNAGAHNAIYRGKSLGSEVTAEQYAAIDAGTFEGLYIGDYWTIGGVNYRIAHFNYWLHCGDTECTTHHVVLVPDTNLYTAKMNDSNVTTGAYVGSAMYTTNLAQAKTTINTAFGESHILNHREYLANAMKATTDPTYESAGNWYDSTIELMNERMVYGADVFHNVEVNGAIPNNYTIDKSQLALFALDPSRICNGVSWWLRDVVSGAAFASVNGNGRANAADAGNSLGVRPAFGICKQNQ